MFKIKNRVKKRIIWCMQFIINVLFMWPYLRDLAGFIYSGGNPGWLLVVDIVVIGVGLISAYWFTNIVTQRTNDDR
jgi:hypothetical protein